MSAWQSVKLGDVADLKGGYAFKSGEYSNDGMFVLRTVNIGNNGEITKDGATYIPHSKVREYERFLLKAHDILFVMVGATLGKIGYVRESALPALLNQNMWVIRTLDDNKLDQRYLHYCFKYFSSKALGWASGSARGFVKRDDFRNLDLEIPPIDEQKQIASLLTAADDKIELNRRMNETLGEIARALFKSWFVNFDPVRAKAKGRKPEGMDAATAALFPAAFNDDGLPEGWTTKKLSDVTSELRRGISPKYTDVGGIRVLNQKCIRDSVVSFSPARHHNHLSKPVKDRELIRGDILVNSTGVGTLGRVAQIWTLEEPTVVDSHVTVVRAKKTKITSTYLGLNLLTRQSEIEGLGEGSTGQTELNRGRLGNLNLTAPPLPLLERFENILTPFIDKMSCNQAENILLSSLRDTLLPKLISGELRIEHIKRNQGN